MSSAGGELEVRYAKNVRHRAGGFVMITAKEPPTGPLRHGRLAEFFRRDLFSVKLDNGVTITAVMREELFPIYDPNVSLTLGTNWISVDVEMREPPAMPRIVSAYH
jgi:hypothetical protein